MVQCYELHNTNQSTYCEVSFSSRMVDANVNFITENATFFSIDKLIAMTKWQIFKFLREIGARWDMVGF